MMLDLAYNNGTDWFQNDYQGREEILFFDVYNKLKNIGLIDRKTIFDKDLKKYVISYKLNFHIF